MQKLLQAIKNTRDAMQHNKVSVAHEIGNVIRFNHLNALDKFTCDASNPFFALWHRDFVKERPNISDEMAN